MVDDGTLRSTPTVSDESVLSATARAGLHADSFAATIEVTQLARAQSAYSGIVADRTAAIGQGTMTLSIGGTRSEEHTSELQSLMRISSAVLCLKQNKTSQPVNTNQ